MTAKELAQLPADRVRKDKDLMRLYIEKYEAVFFSKPNCAGCTFSGDFTKFKRAIIEGIGIPTQRQIKNLKIMDKTFKLKHKHANDIFTYRVENKAYRIYGHLMTEEFAKEFLKNGSKQEIEERKKFFEKLPESNSKSVSAKTEASTLETKENAADVSETIEKTVSKPKAKSKSKKSKK